jgi:molybdopterin-guanine dinucleotide biosynthesis protein A
MHSKHPPLARPRIGYYGRTEFALVGSTCQRMEAIMHDWADRIGQDHCLLVTGEHAQPEVAGLTRRGHKTFASGRADWSPVDDRLLGQGYELVLVNGNHYPAARQIVFLDTEKAGTLERRAQQLTDIAAIVRVDAEQTLPDWLQPIRDRQAEPPLEVGVGEIDRLLPLIERAIAAARPSLKALLLVGGKSERMGADKSELVYRNGQPEWQRLRDLCTDLSIPVHLSVATMKSAPSTNLPIITDRFPGLGPLGAIASAFLTDPDAAWLVLACDLPLLDKRTLEFLVNSRQYHQCATAPRRPDAEWPEPLVTIYEPRAYERMLRFLSLGYACPRKVLINSPTAVLPLADGRPLTNANTPEERAAVLTLLGDKRQMNQQTTG